MHGGEAGVAGGHGIATFGLEVVQEGADERASRSSRLRRAGEMPLL
jgi:hypothetical protein